MSADYVCQILWAYVLEKIALVKVGAFAWYSKFALFSVSGLKDKSW